MHHFGASGSWFTPILTAFYNAELVAKPLCALSAAAQIPEYSALPKLRSVAAVIMAMSPRTITAESTERSKHYFSTVVQIVWSM